MESGGIRINKYLAMSGICSRREADRLIDEGSVSVNGQAAERGIRVSESDIITVCGKKVEGIRKRRVLAFYKPRGVLCTSSDPHGGSFVGDYIDAGERFTYAGRLDKDSEGLLLLTNDGGLIDEMMRGSAGHEKEYEVKTDVPVTDEAIKRMEDGMYLPGLSKTTRPCRVRRTGESSFNIILTQGMNRQIRRMCEECGLKVRSLKRVRVVNITLDGLKPGEYRELSKEQISELERSCKAKGV